MLNTHLSLGVWLLPIKLLSLSGMKELFMYRLELCLFPVLFVVPTLGDEFKFRCLEKLLRFICF